MEQQNPVYQLALAVRQGDLQFSDALSRITAHSALWQQMDDGQIDQLDDYIRALAGAERKWGLVLAELNCKVAVTKLGTAVYIRGNCHNTLGRFYLKNDRLTKALENYRHALAVFDAMPGAEATVAQIRLDLAEIYEQQHDFQSAKSACKTALDLARTVMRLDIESDALNSLGSIHLFQGKVDKAKTKFQKALKFSRKNNIVLGEETSLGNLGLANFYLGRLSEAVDYSEQALILSKQIGHELGTGRHLGHLGRIFVELGKLPEAEKQFEEAIKIARSNDDAQILQQRLGDLGNLYRVKAEKEGKHSLLAKAHTYINDALTIARQRGDARSQADFLLDWGNTFSQSGHWEKAQACYAEALALAEERAAVDTQWRIHYAWGRLDGLQQKDELAFRHLETAVQIVEGQRSQLRIESRTKFWQEKAAVYKEMALCCLRRRELWFALVYTELAKTRYLADLLEDDRTPSPDETQVMIGEVLKQLPERAAVVVFNVTKRGTAVFIAAHDPHYNASSDDDWRTSPDGLLHARLIEAFDQAALQEMLVKLDSRGKVIGGYLIDYYSPSRLNRLNSLETLCVALHKNLLCFVHQKLTQLRIEQVVFMPNLGLSILPLHAGCQIKDKERDSLCDHYKITYAPSFQLLRQAKEQTPTISADDAELLAITNPTGDLVWATLEAEEIARLFSEARLLDGNLGENRATKETVITDSPEYAYLHFACHGKFNLSQPLESYLELAPPDVLSLEELILKKLKLPRTRLVVMSACETGLIDSGDLADEYIGLASGFLLANVPGIISALWRVDDFVTMLLMVQFYSRHLNGSPPDLALQEAQEWLRKATTAELIANLKEIRYRLEKDGREHEPIYNRLINEINTFKVHPGAYRRYAHPYYWAAFTFMGA